MKEKRRKSNPKSIIWPVFTSLLLQAAQAVSINEFKFYTGAEIFPAEIEDHQTLSSIPALTIDSEESVTLSNFATSIPIQAGPEFHLLVEIETRGATFVMVAISEGDEPTFDIGGGNARDELIVNCFDLDYDGVERMEKFHLLDKSFTGAGYFDCFLLFRFLTIVVFEGFTQREPTEVNIRGILDC
jgi:hypothetical protein